MTDNTELRECPFCGGPAGEAMWRNHVGCLNADCAAHHANVPIAAWNRRPKDEVVEALPPGRTKQDVANLVDLAMSDALVNIDHDGRGPEQVYDYDILVEKLRGNGLALVALTKAGRSA